MSIDHKAYLFQYDEFHQELADLLHRALESGEVEPLREFINFHRPALTDPWMEGPLEEDWEDEHRQNLDIQLYADVALTKYYDLTDNLGLSYGFDALGVYLNAIPSLARHADSLICGALFGPKGKRLDPGRMGTGLLPAVRVAQLAKILTSMKWPAIPDPESPIYAKCYYRPTSTEDVAASRTRLEQLFRRAAKAGPGIMFTDFNDGGVSQL